VVRGEIDTRPRLLIATTISLTLRSFLMPFGTYFRRLGYRVDAMAHGVEADRETLGSAFDHLFEVSWTRRPWVPWTFCRAVKQVRGVVDAGGYDVIHVHTPVAAFVTRLSLPREGRAAVIYTAHGFHFHGGGKSLPNAVYRMLEKIAGRWTDFLVVVNQEDFEAAKRHCLVDPGRLRLIPGVGIDTGAYCPDVVLAPDVEKTRAELALRDGEALVVMVAEFNTGKRHRDALMALSKLRRRDVVLAFAGEGPERSKIEALASRLGLTERVRFLGYREDVKQLMRTAVATVLPSDREGLSRSVMESMSLEVPVIGANSRGIRDLIAGGGGVLVPIGDADRIAAAIDWVVDHPEEATGLGRRGRCLVQPYRTEVILKLYGSLFEEAVAVTRDVGRRSQAPR